MNVQAGPVIFYPDTATGVYESVAHGTKNLAKKGIELHAVAALAMNDYLVI